jgi:hypothetical protein
VPNFGIPFFVGYLNFIALLAASCMQINLILTTRFEHK